MSSITGTITAINSGNWTAGCWLYFTANGDSQYVIVTHNGSLYQQSFALVAITGGMALRADQQQNVFQTAARSNVPLPLSTWIAAFATYRESTRQTHLFYGTRSAAVVEDTVNIQTGDSPQATGGVNLSVGAGISAALPFNGRIARPFLAPSEWSLANMDSYRTGTHADAITTCRFSWRMTHSGTPVADFSGNSVAGTITGATEVRGPY